MTDVARIESHVRGQVCIKWMRCTYDVIFVVRYVEGRDARVCVAFVNAFSGTKGAVGVVFVIAVA